MSFDEEIERIYLNAKNLYDIPDKLEKVLTCYPKEHKLLVGLRASYLKQRLILEERIDKYEHDEVACGCCIALENIYGHFECRICPLAGPCFHRGKHSDKHNLKAVYKAYMKEHKKFEK